MTVWLQGDQGLPGVAVIHNGCFPRWTSSRMRVTRGQDIACSVPIFLSKETILQLVPCVRSGFLILALWTFWTGSSVVVRGYTMHVGWFAASLASTHEILVVSLHQP